eukprot:352421-Chlamydomonas_euryale.AAC.35
MSSCQVLQVKQRSARQHGTQACRQGCPLQRAQRDTLVAGALRMAWPKHGAHAAQWSQAHIYTYGFHKYAFFVFC